MSSWDGWDEPATPAEPGERPASWGVPAHGPAGAGPDAFQAPPLRADQRVWTPGGAQAGPVQAGPVQAAPMQPAPVQPAPVQPPAAGPAPASDALALADGAWHRMHWSTPLLSGGIILAAFLGWIFSSVFSGGLSALLAILLDQPQMSDGQFNTMPWGFVASGAVWLGIVAVATISALISWRVHEFRLGQDVLELRKGLISRAHRQIRIDRIQSVSVSRGMLGALFGAAKLEFDAAGEDANIELAYLRHRDAEALRAEVLRRASGARRAKTEAARAAAQTEQAWPGPGQDQGPAPTPTADLGQPTAPGRPRAALRFEDFLEERLAAITGPELDPQLAAQSSVVNVSFARILASSLLSYAVTLLVTIVIVGLTIGGVALALPETDRLEMLGMLLGITAFSLVPVVLGLVASAAGTARSMARFTIAGTPDGLRIGRGFVATLNDTLPPGRIHAVEVRQSPLWRPFGWWTIRVTRATGKASGDDAEKQALRAQNILLPVGTEDEVRRVLAIALPMHMGPALAEAVAAAMTGRNGAPGDRFRPASRSAGWLHPFLVRRAAHAVVGGALVIRQGAWLRRAVIVPTERIQSIGSRRGVLDRLRGTASLDAHTVFGPVSTTVPLVPAEEVEGIQDALVDTALRAAANDTTHRWAEASARSAVATARMHAADAQRAGAPLDPTTRAILAADAEWERARAQGLTPVSTEGRA